MKKIEKFDDVKYIIEQFGGRLGGSRLLRLNEESSDWDFFFTEKADFESAKKFLEIIDVPEGDVDYLIQKKLVWEEKTIPVFSGHYHKPVMVYETIKQFVHKDECIKNENKIHLTLVGEILSMEKQLFFHLGKHPEKIWDLQKSKKIGDIFFEVLVKNPEEIKNGILPRGWEDWVYKKSFGRYLSVEQKKEYVIWLSDNKKSFFERFFKG